MPNEIDLPEQLANQADQEGTANIVNIKNMGANMLFYSWFDYKSFYGILANFPHINGCRSFLYSPASDRSKFALDIVPYPYIQAKKKWDLSQWRDDYTVRFKERVESFAKMGKYSIISLIDYCALRSPAWSSAPWNKNNNIQKWGTDNYSESKFIKEPSIMLHLVQPLFDTIKKIIDPKLFKYVIIELANEPNTSLDLINATAKYLMVDCKLPRNQTYGSITPGCMDLLRSYPRPNYLQSLGVLYYHSMRTPQDWVNYDGPGLQKSFKNVKVEWSTDGAKSASGGWLSDGPYNLTKLTPQELTTLVNKVGPAGDVITFASDQEHAPWETAWKHLPTLCAGF